MADPYLPRDTSDGQAVTSTADQCLEERLDLLDLPGHPPLARCERTPAIATLADLAREGLAAPPGGDALPKQCALGPVHVALDVVVGAVAVPSGLLGAGVMAGPGDLGAFLTFGAAPVRAVWLDPAVPVMPAEAPAATGARTAALLAPLLERASGAGRIGLRTLHTIALESLVAACGPIQRRSARPDWLAGLMTGTGWTSRREPRHVTCRPSGVEVTVPARSVCCALLSRPDAGSCPSCPLHPGRTRQALTAEWLQSLSPDEFAFRTGVVPVAR